MSKRVNIYYAGFSHRVGGAFHHVVNLKKGMEEQGFSVNVITLDSIPLIFRYIPHIIQLIGNFINFPMGFLYKQKVIRYFYSLKYKNSCDIEIFEDIYTYWSSNTISIVILHALWSDNLQAFNAGEQRRKKLEKKETRIINKIHSPIITVSEPYKKFILSRLNPFDLNKNIDVIELGIDINKFKKAIKNNNSILFVGSLEARKNILFLLKVYKLLQAKSNNKYSLTIVGDGPQKTELKEFAKGNNLKKLNILGRLSYDEVISEMPKHTYYVHTSLKESFSYALLEAKLSGLITIAYSKLQVPKEFIDIKMGSFDENQWVQKIESGQGHNNKFENHQFSYRIMTQRTIDKLHLNV